MLCTPKRAAVRWFESTSNFPTKTRPASSVASVSIVGAMSRHGPHHAAHMSSKTGSGERSTNSPKLESVTVSGVD
jgi:hypothetical protein